MQSIGRYRYVLLYAVLLLKVSKKAYLLLRDTMLTRMNIYII